MKRILILLALTVLMLIPATSVFAQTPYTTDLIADGRGTAPDVGDLTVDTNSANLTVNFQIDEANVEWRLEETHLFVGDAPPSKSAPGRFPYKNEGLGGAASYLYEIDLAAADKDGDGVVWIAAHAELIRQIGIDPDTQEPIFEDESAWAQGEKPIGKGNNWATCFMVELP